MKISVADLGYLELPLAIEFARPNAVVTGLGVAPR
jgi:UDP-N-acetyl-D-mannosaminuronate dehydrogenase